MFISFIYLFHPNFLSIHDVQALLEAIGSLALEIVNNSISFSKG